MSPTHVTCVHAARRLLSGLVLVVGLLSGLASNALAQGVSDSPYFGDPLLSGGDPFAPNPVKVAGGSSFEAPTLRVGGNSADLDQYFQVPGGGHGIIGRIGHVAGPTVGRDDSLTHVNLQPYVFIEENMFFGDFRMYRLNDAGVGGNIGGGWRGYFADHDAILGAVGYYDVDDTRSQEFQQMGLSLELFTRWLDVRANWYIPFGETEQILGTTFVRGSQRFQENLLLVDTITTFGNAAEGVDVTGTVPVPWEMLEPYHVEMSAGFYHYQVRDEKLPNLWGWRLRADASFFNRMLHTFVELTNDRQHDTNVVFGASLDYYGGFENRSRIKDRQYYRMSEFVRRSYNVVTIESDVLNTGVPVINPATGNPYFFVHIDQSDLGGGLMNGTFENPFELPNQAFTEAPNGEVFLVHGGNTYMGDDATIVVPEGKIFLGENVPGRPQTLPSPGLGDVELPSANPGAGPVNLFQSTGSAIDGTNALLVGAFTIVDPNENGLLVTGPSALTGMQFFRDISIFGADGDGILFENAAGTYDMIRVTVAADDTFGGVAGDGAMGNAFHVSGGSAIVTAFDVDSDVLTAPTFENSGNNQNEIILIENTLGGTINLTQTTANDHGGAFAAGLADMGGGIRLINNAGGVALGEARIENTAVAPGVGAGVEIRGGTGNTSLFGDITIVNAAGVGFLVEDLQTLGQVNVSGGTDITVQSRNDIGADFRNIAGTVLFSPTLVNAAGSASSLTIDTLNPATNTTTPAVRFSASSGTVSLNNVTVNGSNAEGIQIGDLNSLADQNADTARFIATGNTNINSTIGPAIRIEGSPINGANPLAEAAMVTFRDNVNINQRIGRGIQIINTTGRIDFTGITTVNNDAIAQSTRAGVHIRDNISSTSFNDLIINDIIPGEPAMEVHNIPRPGGVAVSNLAINNAQGEGADRPGGDGDLTQGLPADTTGLLVLNVNSFTISDGVIDVEDGIAVDIQNVFAQTATGQRIVFDSLNRPVIVDADSNPLFVLDDETGGPLLDPNGNPIVPNIFTLRPAPGYQVVLTEVNAIATSLATAQPFGIFLRNNTGSFEVRGVAGVQGSGGEISGTLPNGLDAFSGSGLFADDADEVIIRWQDYIGNQRGLTFFNMNENVDQGFVLDAIRVQDSIQEAVLATDIRNILIEDSSFQNNGFVDLDPDPLDDFFSDTILIRVNELPDDPFEPNDEDNPGLFPYNYSILRNTFLDNTSTSGSDAVQIVTTAGFARGARLTLFFQDNNFLSIDRDVDNNDAPRLLAVDWNGTIDALISGNVANFVTRNSPRGFEIRQRSTDHNDSQVVVRDNILNFNNSPNAIGAFFDFVGSARIDANFNNFDMGVGGSRALFFRLLGENNDVEIDGNVFDFGLVATNVGSGVGIDVLQVVGPSLFTINNNVIGSTAADAAAIGIRFQTLIGTTTIFGPQQNTMFANTFFTPVGNPNLQGSININGTILTLP